MYILCIEDDSEIQKIIKENFRNENIDVEFTYSLEEGIYKLEMNSLYDAVILDRVLPDGDGITLLKYMEQKQINIPCLILSVLGSVENKIEGLSLGAYDYLTKPFDIRELLIRVKNIIKIRYNIQTNIVRIGNVSINLFSRKVYVKDKNIKLTPQEYKILKLLMTNRNKVIEKSEIMDRLGIEQNESHNSNIVDVLVYRLRKKLGKQDFIQNIKKIGYVIYDE
ncbi:response regulator transcription factor [Nitratiruptor sp. SB155-2]|uniref:response regulator transcription factor n=1 Tax=Nitratiruptor sp. (strain SB155-2) TaxID=387092 RepID=UPI0001587127|nr:response regulator transcription factor [Nitratiruptor sp. SB155-2]BAF70025.1 two-component response regulator [Nitratiruptor sp. SB155-2]